MRHSPPPSLAAAFDLAAVEAGIRTTQFAGQVQHFTTTGSTSTLALEAAQAGAFTGVWTADEQTAGRGRNGHTWHSTAGDGLYVSILIRPRVPLANALQLSLATGLAAQSAIAEITSLQPDIRWPNDLLLNTCKCGGILVETAIAPESNTLRYAVIGIGINVNHADFPPELSALATSIRRETGTTWPREPLLAALLRALDHEIHLLETDTADLFERFSAASSWVRGKHVHVGEADGYTGITSGLNSQGFLLVEGDDGVRHTVFSGGVRAI